MADPLRPVDEADLTALVGDAAVAGQVLAVDGGGSRASVGEPHVTDARVVDLRAFSGVIDYEPTELVLTAFAGTPLAQVEALLASNGQMLAFEPPHHGALTGRPGAIPTLGGAVAANSSGPRRLSAGAARDHFLGFRAVSGRGEGFKAGSKVVKNVTGFDLSKVMAGSWGTLAILTQVSVKVLPRPATTATLVLSGLAPAAACAAMARACGSSAPITGAAHLPGPVALRLLPHETSGSATLLRLEGFDATVAARLDFLTAALADFGPMERLGSSDSSRIWRGIGEVAPLAPLTSPLWRVSIPAAEAAAFVRDLPDEHWMMDWAGGLIWVAADLAPKAPGRDGHIRYWGGAPAARPQAGQYLTDPALRVSRALKAAFDPADILNRGRILPPLTSGTL